MRQMHDNTNRFISGIYNYCDRWCERCRFTDRCQVFHREQQQWERHLLKGEDPDDLAVAMQDVAESLDEAMQMLEQMAEEQGLDLSEEEEEEEPLPAGRRDPWEHPLAGRAHRWMMRVAELLKRLRADLPAIGQDLAAMAPELSEREQDETVQGLEALRDAYEVLGFYHTLIPVKMARATGSWSQAEEKPHPELAVFSRDDALGTAKLVAECLEKSTAALWRVAEFSQDWQDEALPLAAETESLRQEMDRAFPGYREYHRPGLDDAVV